MIKSNRIIKGHRSQEIDPDHENFVKNIMKIIRNTNKDNITDSKLIEIYINQSTPINFKASRRLTDSIPNIPSRLLSVDFEDAGEVIL